MADEDMNDDLDLDALIDGVVTPKTAEKAAEPERSLDREGYAWAADVYWAYENMGGRMSRERAGTPGRYALWRYASKNVDDFMKALLPKAMGILEKARDKEGDLDIVENEEKKSIAEMQRLLRRAVAEAAGNA